jgi:hypothetical protein
MLFGEIVAVYCENHMEHTDIICGQNAEFWWVNAGATYTNHHAMKRGVEVYSTILNLGTGWRWVVSLLSALLPVPIV